MEALKASLAAKGERKGEAAAGTPAATESDEKATGTEG